MKRSLRDIIPVPSSHNVGLKRVLLSAEESGCAITQVAVTKLVTGEKVEAHVHPDMQEGFYILSGKLEIVLDGRTYYCQADDFLFVRCGISHELKVIKDVKMVTFGCKSK